jgi:hypothetical protein
MIPYLSYFEDVSFSTYFRLRSDAQTLNLRIKHQSNLAQIRPSKQSRKEALSRANYYRKQRDALLNLYPEVFI